MKKTYRIACIPGDGIGKEVVPAGQAVLEALAAVSSFQFAFENFGWGGDWFRAHGEMMPKDGLDALRNKDAILFGSAGDPDIPDHITLWGLRLKICQGFDQYANVRPTRILPGIDAPLKRCTPAQLDWVIVRENSEGEYSGIGGRAHQGHPIEVATDVSMMTRAGVERIMRYAFKLAQSRPRKLLTVVTKSNAQRHAMVMWDEIALQVSQEFPEVTWDKELVDACTARMVNRPGAPVLPPWQGVTLLCQSDAANGFRRPLVTACMHLRFNVGSLTTTTEAIFDGVFPISFSHRALGLRYGRFAVSGGRVHSCRAGRAPVRAGCCAGTRLLDGHAACPEPGQQGRWRERPYPEPGSQGRPRPAG